MKRVVVGIIGGTVVLIGIAMLVFPGPGLIVIPAGLAILATEFVWAKRWLRSGKGAIHRWKDARADGRPFRECLKRTFSFHRAKRSQSFR